jgi:hypothetical protein
VTPRCILSMTIFHAGEYTLVAINGYGEVCSQKVKVGIHAAPVIIHEPQALQADIALPAPHGDFTMTMVVRSTTPCRFAFQTTDGCSSWSV